MKLKWYGHSCFSMTFADGTTLVTDPFDASVGYPMCGARCDAALLSHDHFDHNHTSSLTGDFQTIQALGTAFVGNVKITGLSSFHDDVHGAKRGSNVVYVVEGDGLKIAHLGDLGHQPDEALVKALQNVDVLLLPIGGTYTIDTPQALELIARLRPRMAVAMHFRNRFCRFDITDAQEFVARTGAAEIPSEIEITPEAKLPAAAVMQLPQEND